jgi:hypothetical protein
LRTDYVPNNFGGRAVLLISGDITNVPAADWEFFLKQQEQLRESVQVSGDMVDKPLKGNVLK